MSLQDTLRSSATKQLNKAFRSFDSDGSGYLQMNEFSALLKRITNAFHVQEPTLEEIQDIWKELDYNGDGKLSKNQFNHLIEDIVKIILQEKKTKLEL